MILAALIILWTSCFYLLGLGATMLFAPDRARRFLSAFAQTPTANLIEATLRLTAGFAFIAAAPVLDHPLIARYFGIFLAVTALMFIAVPSLHRRFAGRSVTAVLPFLPWLGAASIMLAIMFAVYLV